MSGTRPHRVRNGHIEIAADGASAQKLGLKLAVALAAESSDVIEATVSITDSEGNAVAQAYEAELQLLDGSGDATNPGTAFEMDVTTGTGITAGTQDSMLITSSAAGVLVVDITDVAGASGATVQLLARPLNINAAPIRAAVTFD